MTADILTFKVAVMGIFRFLFCTIVETTNVFIQF